MILILGLTILVAAVVVGVAGVLANGGSAHALAHGFAVFGYHVTGSTGTLFLYGLVVGALALLGLSLVLAAARRTSRLGSAARRGLEQSRDETIAARKDRDDLIDQREAGHAETPSTPEDDFPRGDVHPNPGDGQRSKRYPLGRHAISPQPATRSTDR
ncbi:MAG: hypothetical protein ACLPUG_15265 [Acidimicrobiales bacterium]|jgi:hypothetical protein